MDSDQGEDRLWSGGMPGVLILLLALSVAADEAIWYSGPESCGGICVSSPPGSEPVPLHPAILETIEDDFISSFDLSPDGRSIAFLELREGHGWHYSDLWVMDADGTHLRQILEGGRGYWHPRNNEKVWKQLEWNNLSREVEWSPYGMEILLCVYFSFVFLDIAGNVLESQESDSVWGDRHYRTDLQWMKTGEIVYQGQGLHPDYPDTVFVRTRDGEILRRIHVPAVQRPRLSPDGSQLAFVQWESDDGPDHPERSAKSSIYLTDVDANYSYDHRRFLASGHVYDWSPSGSHIVHQDADGLYRTDMDGNSVFLFSTSGEIWDVDWIATPPITSIQPASWGAVKQVDAAR